MKKQRGNTPLVIGAGPRNAGTNLRQDAEKRLHPQHRARPLRVLSRDAAQNGPHERVRPARQSGGPRTGSVRRRGPQPVIRLFIVTVLRLGQTDPFQTPPPPGTYNPVIPWPHAAKSAAPALAASRAGISDLSTRPASQSNRCRARAGARTDSAMRKSNTLEDKRPVGATESEGIFHGVLDAHGPRGIGAVVQITFRVGRFQIDRRRRHLVVQGQYRKN